MSGVRIELDERDYASAMTALGGALDSPGRNLLLADIGQALRLSTLARAEQERSPSGDRWPALSPRYKALKAKIKPGRKMLKFAGEMLGSRFSYQVLGGTLLLGTNARYGATMQFGRDEIPARPWLGLSADDEVEIAEIVKDHLLGGIGS